MRTSFIGLVIFLIFQVIASPGFSQTENDHDEILLTSDIKPGMTGYGLTTLKSNEIVQYPIEVLSVMGNRGGEWPHFRSILIKIGEGELPEGWTGFQQDMAGSPVYINDKLIGAISTFYEWSMQEIAQVSPIEEMFLIAERHNNFMETRNNQRKVLLENTKGLESSISDIQSVVYADYPSNEVKNIRALSPGDAVAAVWSIGDYTKYEKGNITNIYDNGDFFAFGKSVFNRAGWINAPIIRSEVLHTFEGLNNNFQVTNPGLIVGTILQDRSSGVYGKLGLKPELVPVNVNINDVPYNKSFNALTLVLKDERFYPSLIPEAVSHSIKKHLDISWQGTIDITFKIDYTIDSGAQRSFEGRNIFFGDNIHALSISDLEKTLFAFSENDFGIVEVENVNVNVFWTHSRETARIQDIRLIDIEDYKEKEDIPVIETGSRIKLNLEILPYKGNLIEKEIEFEISDDFPEGDAIIQVRGGGSLVPRIDDISQELHKSIEDAVNGRTRIIDPLPPSGLDELLKALPFNEPNNLLIIEIISTEKTPPRGESRFNQVYKKDMDVVLFGFDSIPIKIES